MTTDQLSAINLMESQFTLQSGQRLGFVESTARFCIIDKDAKQDKDCKTSLRYLCRKVDDLYRSENLTPDQALFLKLNVTQVNTLYHKYNDAIAKHRFYNFLDKLVWILTFGSIRLTYSDVNTSFLDFKVSNVMHTMRFDRELYVRMLRFFTADSQRVHLFSNLVKGMISSADFELDEEGMNQYIKVANTYFERDPGGHSTEPLSNEKIFKTLQHLVAHPELMAGSQYITKEVFDQISEMDFELLETAVKEQLIQALEAVQKSAPSQFEKFFVKPKSAFRIIEHVEPIAISGNAQIKNSVAAIMPELLKNAFSKFDEMTLQEQMRITAIAAEQKALNSQSLTAKQRLPLLTEVCSFEGEALWSSPVADPLYRYCLGRYDALSAEEKPYFFKLFASFGNPNTLKNSRAMLMDYVNYLIQPKTRGTTDIARIVYNGLDAVYGTLNDDEKTTYFKFLDIYRLAKELTPQRVEELLKYLADHLTLIQAIQSLAVQLFTKQRNNDTAASKQLIQAHQPAFSEYIELTKLSREDFLLFIKSAAFIANQEKHVLKIDYDVLTPFQFEKIVELPSFAKNVNTLLFKINFALLSSDLLDKVISLPCFAENVEKFLEKIHFGKLTRKQFNKILKFPRFAQNAANFLFKVNFSTLAQDQFDEIVKMPFFKENADIYLATAIEEQLETYYGPSERDNFKVNLTHLKTKVHCPQALDIPPLPQMTDDIPPKPIVAPELSELFEMAKDIQFKKNTDGSYDPPIKDDSYAYDGSGQFKVVDVNKEPSDVHGGISLLIRRITEKIFYLACPDEFVFKDNKRIKNPDFDKYFAEMKLCLQHIILALRSKPSDERSAVIIQLAMGGSHCAMRHKRDARQMLALLGGNPIDVDENLSVQDMILTCYVRYRKSLLIDAAHILNSGQLGIDVHLEDAVVHHVGPLYGVHEQGNYDDRHDPWNNDSSEVRKNKINRVLEAIKPKYEDPNKLITLVDKLLNDPKKTQKSDFREKLIDIIKQKRRPGESEWDAVANMTVYGDSNFVLQKKNSRGEDVNGFKIKREGLTHLLESFGLIVKKTAAEKIARPPPTPQRVQPPSSLSRLTRRWFNWF